MGSKITIDEVVKRYKDTELKFSSYYKFSFTFIGVAEDGVKIVATIGGDSSNIYREEIFNNETRKLGDIVSDWSYVCLNDKNDEEIFCYYNC